MSKYIKLEDALSLAEKGVLISNSNYDKVCKAIESLPTIEITQCRDCKNRKHRVFEVAGEGICTEICLMFGKIIFNDNEFCNFGERKESEEE